MPNPNDFAEFFEKWLLVKEEDLGELIAATRAYNRAPNLADIIQSTKEVADRVVSHYEHYYKVKADSTPGHVYQMLNPPWHSTIEGTYLWIGGWRPSMAFHVLYSKTGLQLEERLDEFLDGIKTNDLGEISTVQIKTIDKLQQEILHAEKNLTEKWAECQESIADTAMVALSNAIYESTMPELMYQHLDAVLSSKEVNFEEVLKEADDLRLSTIKRLISILTPIQTIHFLTSAAELHLKLHEWGMRKDAEHDQITVPADAAGPDAARPSSGPRNP